VPVNILRIEDPSDETDSGFPVPPPPGDMSTDQDYIIDPHPVPPWAKKHVARSDEVVALPINPSLRAPGRITIRDAAPNMFVRCPHHGRYDVMAVSNGTVTLIEAKSPWVKYATDTYEMQYLAGSFAMPMMLYPTSSGTADIDWIIADPIAFADWWGQHQATDPLEGYEAYSVEDWDGYDALPITAETLAAARTVLKSLPKTFGEPVCSPGADGSIVFEWLADDGPVRKLFIDIGPSKTWKAYWRLANGETGTIPRKRITIATIKELQKLFATLRG
jgi:hypothetical protein